MGAKQIIAIVIILVVLVGAVFLVYHIKNKKEKTIASTSKNALYLAFQDENKKIVPIIYVIKNRNMQTIVNGKTLNDTFLEIELPKGEDYVLYWNGGENYYNGYIWLYNFSSSKMLKISLEKIAKINYTISDNVLRYGSNEIIVTLHSSGGIWKGLGLCVDYSFNVIDFDVVGYQAFKPEGVNYLKCYDFNRFLDSSNPNFYFKIRYTTKTISEYDYIDLYIFDKDVVLGKEGLYAFLNGRDIGGENLKISLKPM
jgi:hypothetical protein